MSEKYDEKEREVIRLLLARLFNKAKKMGFSYRQLSAVVKAKSHTTVWRWLKGRTLPTHHHIYHIKTFLGYIK